MNHNQWFPRNNGNYYQQPPSHPSQDPHGLPYPPPTNSNVQSGQRLLAAYPPASATPTHHVSRHMGGMTLTGAATFPQPNYYAPHTTSYPTGNPPPYSEYDRQLQYVASAHAPVNGSGYWENTRDDAVRMLNAQAAQAPQYRETTQWMNSGPQSSYHTPPFAQSVLQRTTPSSAYPTPPPPGLNASSSSLAHALGPPSARPHAQPQATFQPQQSRPYFDDFLDRKVQQSDRSAPPAPAPAHVAPPVAPRQVLRPVTPPPKTRLLVEESPDPLALKSGSSVAVTPQKRKAVVEIAVSPKRLQFSTGSNGSLGQSTQTKTPQSTQSSRFLTPSTSTTSLSASTSRGNITPTPSRIANKAYVSVPSTPWLTPASSRKGSTTKMNLDTPGDLGGYGSEEDDPSSPIKRLALNDSVKSSARRTGDRDDRGPLEKLTSWIEDIFEAEDTLPADIEAQDLNHDFFSSLSKDCSRPQLASSAIRKLTKYIGYVARPTKRLRQATVGVTGTPKGKGRMSEVDTEILSRLLKILDRSVKAGEDIDPFVYHGPPPTTKSSPKKPSAKKGKKKTERSQTPKEGEAAEDEPMDEEPAALTEDDFAKLSELLDTARDSILAADSCIALLGSDRLTKQLYSEELITSCLNTVKNQLTKILYPFVEASAEAGHSLHPNPLLVSLVKSTHASAAGHRKQLGELFQALSVVIPRINNLINAESVAMSDTIIISAVYIAIGPFFVVDGGAGGEDGGHGKGAKKEKENVVIKTLGKSAMRGLRLDALSLIRSIFANHEDQRSWIIEEILTSLIKLNDTKQKAGQFRLRDGRSIRTVSALLMQLVQTSAHDVRIKAKKLAEVRKNKFALRRQESFTESQQANAQPEPFLDETDREEIELYTTGLESATKAAKTIILFLTQRSGKGKATKNSNEAEYRAIFDNFIEDLLAVLFWPEWPAASLILSIASKFMVSSLDDVKTNAQTDSNAAKQMALDHLGVIAAKIRASTLKIQQQIAANPGRKTIRPLDEAVQGTRTKYLNRLLDAHRDVASHLCKRASEDQAYDSARELTAATLGYELAGALKQVDKWIEHPEADDDLNIKDGDKLLTFGRCLKTALPEVWKDPSTDVFDIGSQEEALKVDRIAEEIGTVQSIRNSFNPILNTIIQALDAPQIFMRTKALKALGQIVTSDATILATNNVRRAIESHLLDSSPAVRDAAVELIGKYMIDSPEVAGDYYQKIADRIADTGLGVRKRVIKLLKSFYTVTEDNSRRIDIATRLVLRMLDEDDTVKDLAIKSIEELWFPATPLPSALKTRGPAPTGNVQDKTPLLGKVAVIMGTSANFKDRQSPLEDVLHKIMAAKEGVERSSLHTRYGEICEALIDGLVDASDLPGFTVINCIRTIYLLTSAYPSILSGTNASTLLPYLKNATTAEEMQTTDYLLKIFKVTIPHMPKTAAKFGHELQQALQPMIIKPSGSGGVQLLQESVGCMCIVVQHLTHDFVRLVNLLKSCNGRMQQMAKRPAASELGANEIRALTILIFIVALLAENCNFDNLRKDHSNLAADLDSISKGSITEHIYLTLLILYDKYSDANLRGRILQCLGFLFRAQPTLMTMERSALIMDEIFGSSDEPAKGRLLKIIQDFLVSEAAKHSAKEKESSKSKGKQTEVNMDELVGNTDGFADSGVSSAIVQRYLDHVLEAALSRDRHMQSVAIDVLTFTIKQGLAHPLQSFPVIVALETSPMAEISNRASALHSLLQGKHSSLLNTRYTVSARKSFEYQKKITADGVVRGFRNQPTPIALLQRWYSHIREKRPIRQDFLKSLAKVFQDSQSFESSQEDVNYTRYMAENFASFDYKTQEEVLTVIHNLTNILSTTGTQLLEILSPSHLLSHLHSSSQSQSQQPPQPQIQVSDPVMTPTVPQVEDVAVALPAPPPTQSDSKEYNQIALMRTSVIIAMVMLLKAHLKTLYSLSEDKCIKFVVGKKSAIGDKPAVKRNDNPISWSRLHFAMNHLLTSEDAEAQKDTFIGIWNEDGLIAEPDDEEQYL